MTTLAAWKFVVKGVATCANMHSVKNRPSEEQHTHARTIQGTEHFREPYVMKPTMITNNRPGAKASPPLCLLQRLSIQQGECKSEKSGETDFKLQRIAAHP